MISKIEFHEIRNQTIEQKKNFMWKIEKKHIAWIFLQNMSCVTQVCIYKLSINPKYIKQWKTYHLKKYIWLGAFRYNCTRGQLNSEGRGELHKIKRSQNKTEIMRYKEIKTKK